MRERTEEQIRKSDYNYGWNCYVESVSREHMPSKCEEGWDAAKAQEEEQGAVIFLCEELIKRMSDAGDNFYEWFRADFETPIQILMKIEEAYRQEKESN